MIEFQGVTKRYRSLIPPRPVLALSELTVEFRRGEVVGIAGPNGAGKTTLLGLALGFLRPSAGSVRVDGSAPRTYVERQGVSYLPEIVAFPRWWRVLGTLRRLAVLSGLAPEERTARVERVIDLLGLEEHRGKRVSQLSKGNRQRLGIAQALLTDSDFVVLDEPTHGLDPVWTQRFRDIVHDLRGPDRCVVVASHNLAELERIADRVVILDRGRVTRVADLHVRDEASSRERYLLTLDGDHAFVPQAFPGARRVDGLPDRVAWEVEGSVGELNAGLADLLREGALVRSFRPLHSRLESVFLDAVGEG